MNILITGSSGLIGSEAAEYFGKKGHKIIGVDNNLRKYLFGEQGDTTWKLKRLQNARFRFVHIDMDIRDRQKIQGIYKDYKPEITIHCAAQPSHDLAARMPFEDFDINATGTLNLLEASREYTHDSPFIFMSTNKVYGDAPNELELVETDTRWDYKDPAFYNGIPEDFRIDQTKHSLFGASKIAADVLTQEYGLYFNMPTVCFRGGCMTGPNHSGVELHGFLSYLVKVAVHGGKYTIFGYKGKQVRDQIHSADVVRAFECFMEAPDCGVVYNLGGGRENSVSVLECIDILEKSFGYKIDYSLSEKNRIGDHVCYISDLTKLKSCYSKWDISISLLEIIKEMVDFQEHRPLQ
tara:strand:+ start:77 stop:1129 length:1053 start_codon:yes stop_codon:yes gene_type:complete